LKCFIYLFILKLGFFGFSQDPVFTQFYNVPEALNPAFTGSTGGDKLGVLNRTQWPGLDYSLTTQFFIYNKYIDYNRRGGISRGYGLGLTVLNQVETVTRYNFIQVNLNYAQQIQIKDDWFFYPAVSVGLGNKDYAFNNLVLGDQILINQGIITMDSSDPFVLNNTKKFLDIGAGFLVFNESLWFGASYKHLNKPNTSFEDEGKNLLYGFLSVHGGYEFPFTLRQRYSNTDFKIHLNFNYMRQNDYDRIDLGSRFQIEAFTFGALATFAPTSLTDNSHKLTSINFVTNLDYKKFRFGYSYDLNVSSLLKTKGVFEISVSYIFDLGSGNNIAVPCGCR
jgi:type IX secretion system PorP/SprF family membrane protein